jgi:hypothetical protein
MMDLRATGKVAGSEFTYNPFVFMPDKMIGLLPETFGLKVVKGNIDVQFKGTRYR